MMEAKGIEYKDIDDSEQTDFMEASTDGRNFAVAGGVAQAVANQIKSQHPDMDVKVVNAEGLENCRKMMKDATKGKYDGYLLEGMACPGGCVAGAGTLQSVAKTAGAVKMYAKKSPRAKATDNELCSLIGELERPEDGRVDETLLAETDEAMVPKE